MSSGLPYRGTVNCFWCMADDQIKIPAFGISKAGHYACSEHTTVLLIAGMYRGPLPEMSESMAIMIEAFQADNTE